MQSQRIPWIDSAKAIGIFLVVFGHLSIPSSIIIFIYSFHMPLFFFLSGVTFKPQGNFKYFFIKKARSILVPYFFFSIITYLFWFFVGRKYGNDAGVYIESWKPIVGIFYSNGVNNWMPYNAVLWFLTCLFVTEIIFFVIVSNFKRSVVVFSVVFLLIVGCILNYIKFIRLPWGVNISLFALCFFCVGYYMKYLLLSALGFDVYFLRKNHTLVYFLLAFTVFIVYILSLSNGRVDMNSNTYNNYIIFFVTGFLGIFCIYIISNMIKSMTCVFFVGRNTLPILAFHSISASLIKGVMLFLFDIKLSILNGMIFWNLILAILSIVLLVPFILYLNKYTPALVGK